MTKIFGLRIIKESTYRSKLSSEENHGFNQGAYAYELNRMTKTVDKFTKASIEITSVRLKRAPRLSYISIDDFYTTKQEIVPTVYDVTFRTKDGELETDIRLYFDDYDVSMSDIQREITRKICGGGCE